MSVGKAIGRVAIKILPDTSNFREGVVRDLKKVEGSLGHVEVDVLLEVTKESKKAAEKEIQAWAKATSPVKVEVKTDLDKKSLKQATKAIDDASDEVRKIKVAFDESSLKSVRKSISQVEAEMDKLRLFEMEVELDQDSLGAMLDELQQIEANLPLELELDDTDVASVKAALAEVNRELRKYSTVKVEVDLDEDSLLAARDELMALVEGFEATERAAREASRAASESARRIARETATAAREAEKSAKLAAREAEKANEATSRSLRRLGRAGTTAVAGLSGLRYTTGLFKRLRDEMMSLDLAVPKIGMISHAISVLGAWALGVAGNLFSLSSSLASMGQAALALPGLLAGIVVGLGVVAAALVDFNKEVPKATEHMNKLQDTISKNFWEEAAAPIRTLVDELFPLLNVKLAEVATAAGGFFAAFANSTISILIPSLSPMFDHLSESIAIATGYTDAFVGIITKLGLVGSAYLPSLATWFGDIATQFDTWLAKMGTDGLTAMIDEGIIAMQDFGSVIGSTFSIFASLGRAAEAAGGATLSSLSDGLKDVAKSAKDPAFQTGLTNTLRASYEMLDQIGAIAGPSIKKLVVAMSENFQNVSPIIGDTVGTAMKTFAEIFSNPAVGKGMEDMMTGFNDLVKAIAPHADTIGEKFGSVFTLIGALASSIGAVLGPAIGALGPTFSNVVDALVPVVKMLGPMIGGVIEQLAPVFEQLGKNFVKIIGKMKPLFKEVQKLLDLLLPILVPVIKVIVSIIGGALMGVIDGIILVFKGFVKIISGVIDVFKGLWDVVAGLFTLDFGRVFDGLKGIFSGLGKVLLGTMQVIIGAIWAYLNGTVVAFFRGFGLKLIKPITGVFKKMWEPLKNGAQVAINFLKGIFSKLGSILSGPFQFVKNAISTAFNWIVGYIKNTIAIWVNIFKTGWGWITTAFSTALNFVKNLVITVFVFIKEWIAIALAAWVGVFTGAWAFIIEAFSTALNFIVGLVTGIFTTVWDWITGAMEGIKETFTGAWDSIVNYVTIVFNVMLAMFTAVWAAIKGFFTTALNVLVEFFKSRWENLKRNTTAIFEALASFFTGIWDRIKSIFTDAVDRVKTFVSNGWNTIKEKTVNAWNAISGKVKEAWETLKDSVVTGVSNAIEKVKELPTKAKNALLNIGTTLLNAGKNLIQGFIDGIKDMFGSVKDTLKNLTDKLTSWKGPPARDKTLLTPAGHLIMDSLIKGFEDRFRAVRDTLRQLTTDIAGFIGTTMSDEISDALSVASSAVVTTSVDSATPLAEAAMSQRLTGLDRHITSAASADHSSDKDAQASISIGNITIPLDQLEQLKSLEDFLELLRVRARQG